MPAPRPLKIKLSQQQRTLLEQVVRRHSSPQGLVQRTGVILSAAKGMNNTQIAQELQLARNTVRTWRQRWLAAAERLSRVEAEGISDKELLEMMVAVLADAPRPGTPATFTTEQVVQIVALACESPHGSKRPVSHWTAQELVSEAVKRGIVDNISQRSVGRLNQIECWFSILVRRLLRRASFSSTVQLSERILEFIDYFNRTMSKPFQWKYKGCKKVE